MKHMASAAVNHIVLDNSKVATIAGTTTKVVEVIADHRIWGWSPDTIHNEYPYLSLAQIYAAFSYYYDHQQEIDAEIDRREQEMERLQAAQPESLGRTKLRDLRLRP
jgi:uncharacterized protein (DUF433 family)